MTTQLLSRDAETAYQPESALTHDSSHAAAALMLRATGLVLLMGVAVIHIVQLVPTFQQMATLGVAFVLLILGAVVVGAWLIKEHRSAVHLWLPVAAFGVAAVLGYAFTRLFSTPLDTQDVGNWSCALGMAALFVEGVLVAIALYAISLRRPTKLSTGWFDLDASYSD